MIKIFTRITGTLLILGCVPLSQQTAYIPTGNELPILKDEALYNETRYVIDNGVNEINLDVINWEGPCLENPVFTRRFQSGYSTKEQPMFRISHNMLTAQIYYGGGCSCAEKKWYGVVSLLPMNEGERLPILYSLSRVWIRAAHSLRIRLSLT